MSEQVKLEEINIIEEDDKNLKSLMKSQDFKQKVSMMLSYAMEFWKCIMSSLLTIFVPQSCGEKVCSISENFSRSEPYGYFTLIFNFFTFFIFSILYYFEAKREFRLINYLEVNQKKARDNNSVENNLIYLSDKRKGNLVSLDKFYAYSGSVGAITFLLNLIFSIIFISGNYLDSQTITVFLTNIIFMASKLYDIYSIINTDTYVFYSAYLTRKIQFNDVDEDKREALLNQDTKQQIELGEE